MSAQPGAAHRSRDERGVVFPSPVMILSIVAVAMAGVAWFSTRPHEPSDHAVTPSADRSVSTTQHPGHQQGQHQRSGSQSRSHRGHRKPALDRSKVPVAVFNNSHVSGLAGRVGTRASQLGWQVVGSDNWYGTIPDSTVYYPPRMAAAGHQLALDLGIHRSMPAVSPMRLDRLTVILTGPLASVS
jgi:LytR cell envelope-related transcriptional attenuator